jgi:hypothetical protein
MSTDKQNELMAKYEHTNPFLTAMLERAKEEQKKEIEDGKKDIIS